MFAFYRSSHVSSFRTVCAFFSLVCCFLLFDVFASLRLFCVFVSLLSLCFVFLLFVAVSAVFVLVLLLAARFRLLGFVFAWFAALLSSRKARKPSCACDASFKARERTQALYCSIDFWSLVHSCNNKKYNYKLTFYIIQSLYCDSVPWKFVYSPIDVPTFLVEDI